MLQISYIPSSSLRIWENFSSFCFIIGILPIFNHPEQVHGVHSNRLAKECDFLQREILRFTLCEKFLSHPCYFTPGSPCIQVFFFNIGCIGPNIILSLSAQVIMSRNVLIQNGGRCDCSIFLSKRYENQASPHKGKQEKETLVRVSSLACKVWIDKSVTRITVWHHSASLMMPNCDP